MATIVTTKDLDVIDKYLCLVKESLGTDSVYIRTKETLEALFEDSALTSTERASVLSSVLGGLSSSITSIAMGTALDWSAKEKDIELRKLELEKQLDILDYEVSLKKAQANNAYHEGVAIQANTRRVHGKPIFDDDGTVTGLEDNCKMYYETEILKKQDVNTAKEGNLLDSKLNESYAAIHKAVADTYINYGSWSYSIGENGLISAPTESTSIGHKTLSSVQKDIATEQAKGYAYNAWGNALTSTSSMAGTALASDIPDGDDILRLMENIDFFMNKFKTVQPPE